MARLDEQRRALAGTLRDSLAKGDELSSTQARLFVRSLQNSWKVPTIGWGTLESHQQFADARRLLHAAGIFTEIDGPGSPDAGVCYRRAGELLEWLTRSSDPVTRDVPVALLSAAAYQMAGLPAMATSLLRDGEFGGEAAAIFAGFLAADFESALSSVARFWFSHPHLTGRAGSEVLLEGAIADHETDRPADENVEVGRKEDNPAKAQHSKVGEYIVAETVRAIGMFCHAIRQGKGDRVALAISKLTGLIGTVSRFSSDELWIMLTLIEATAKRFATDSIHVKVSRLSERLPAQQPRMWKFAREQFARGRGILWPSQVQGLERLVERDSFALCTPTGSGKTLVANLALVKELLLVENQEHAPLALYIVPSRALASEVETKLTAELGNDIIVTGLYGGADWGITDYWLTADKPAVLIATVEKSEALLRYVGHLLVRRLRLMIIDEAHQVVGVGDDKEMRELAAHNSRSMRLESMVSRLLALKPDMPRIALTAVAGGAAGPVSQWMENSALAAPVGLGYRSSRQVIGSLQCDPFRAPQATIEFMNGQPLYVRDREDPVYLPLRIPLMPRVKADVRDSLPHFTEIYTLWTALHLLEGGRRILVSLTQSPERVMKRFAEAFGLPGWENVYRFVPPQDEADRTLFEDARAACIDYCGVESFERRLLDRGIATSHGQMPQRLRRLMVALIERRICPITVATATLTEGVNLPFDIIFLTSLLRRGYDTEEEQPEEEAMTAAEFRNLAGRAGRPGAAESIEGMTLVVLPQSPSTTSQSMKRKSTRQTQLKQIEKAENDFIGLIERLKDDERGDGGIESPLATLLNSIITKCETQLGLRTEAEIVAWLEATLPDSVSANLAAQSRNPQAQLGDCLDELDGFILAATQELTLISGEQITGAAAEVYLRNLWQRTFAHVAAAREDFLERTLVHRGRAFVERLYPNADQRKRLYHFGFTPYIGRRFEVISPAIIRDLADAADFGVWDDEKRFQLFLGLGERVKAEPGFGFRIRNTVTDQDILANWGGVLGWWMQRPLAASPAPEALRTWQRFVADNIEFRLGVAVGASVAQHWSANAGELESPSLETWRETTGLPWIGFWFRELLRWGTLDPFIAFALAQGIAKTRQDARSLRPDFEAWLVASGAAKDPDSLIDPQNYRAWQLARERVVHDAEFLARNVLGQLTGVDGRRQSYDVLPIVNGEVVDWIDPAGFSVARSARADAVVTGRPAYHDFSVSAVPGVQISRTF
ncbi:DEAD/DEAH box helicase [Rhizobium laguerreae]|uniref:DEAD/DEAH box helicase n=1 Tax=Rhizobium laguerreae TaxID=1076926 RepID=UPI00103E526F|nr:DEAD/DEAH box helicase [Rhizobium laguerreae]MBY3231720.1 DEAD/DEAH box helicase [Rhizobium laguerreae]TBY56305.1 DEAD/DEAH box helicase [Rhizobium leguminosarum bv. viciae]